MKTSKEAVEELERGLEYLVFHKEIYESLIELAKEPSKHKLNPILIKIRDASDDLVPTHMRSLYRTISAVYKEDLAIVAGLLMGAKEVKS